MLHFISNREVEYLEEDSVYVENNEQLAIIDIEQLYRAESDVEESASNDDKTIENDQVAHDVLNICQECIQLDIELQKSKAVIAKLQKRCAEKAAEIKRLRAAEKRSKLAKSSLEEVLREMKENKWISSEGEDILNVNKLNM